MRRATSSGPRAVGSPVSAGLSKNSKPSADAPLVLVTGGCGYSGKWLVRRLLNEGYRVRAGDVRPPPPADPSSPQTSFDARAEFVLLDVTNKAQVAAACAGVSAVFHVGALVPFNLSRSYNREALLRVNVEGTRNMLEASRAAGASAFVLCSSTGVVFTGRDIAAGDETMPLPADGKWNDDYSESKARAEMLVLAANDPAGGFRTAAIRPNGIWGPGEQHHTPKLLKMAQLGSAVVSFDGATALTDFTHRDNLCEGFVLALRHLTHEASGKPPATASGKPVAGRVFYVTDGWAAYTTELFSPLLAGIGYTPPFPCAVIRRLPRGGYKGALGAELDTPAVAGVQAVRLSSAAAVAAAAAQYGVKSAAEAGPRDGSGVMLVTGPPSASLPGWLLLPVAAACQAFARALLPLGINVEPFLTLADVRKVRRHNYFSHDLAARELGYKPVTGVAPALLEVVEWYNAQGYSGRVQSPPAAAWATVIVGLAVTGLLAYDVGGSLTAAVTAVDAALPSCGGHGVLAATAAAGTSLLRASGVVPALASVAAAAASGAAAVTTAAAAGWAAVAGAAATPSCGAPTFSAEAAASAAALYTSASLPAADAPRVWAGLLWVVFWAAMLCHGLQGAWAATKAAAWRKHTLGWAAQCAILGFPSTVLLYKAAGRPTAHIPRNCIGLFCACMPLLAVVVGLRAMAAAAAVPGNSMSGGGVGPGLCGGGSASAWGGAQ